MQASVWHHQICIPTLCYPCCNLLLQSWHVKMWHTNFTPEAVASSYQAFPAKIFKRELSVTRKVRERTLSAAGHFHHHQEEAAGTLVLWDPTHGSPGSCHKTYVQVLLEDTGLENISEIISLMEDCKLWRSTAVCSVLLGILPNMNSLRCTNVEIIILVLHFSGITTSQECFKIYDRNDHYSI